MGRNKNFYVVRDGFKTGLFNNYDDTLSAVKGYSKPEWKGFYSYRNAVRYLKGYDDVDEFQSRCWVVERGRATGIFYDSAMVKKAVHGYHGNKVVPFYNIQDAEDYYDQNLGQSSSEEEEDEDDDEEEEHIRRYYAVRRGREIGIFNNCQEALDSTRYYSRFKMKSFNSLEDAEWYMCQRDDDEYTEYYESDSEGQSDYHNPIVVYTNSYYESDWNTDAAVYEIFYGDSDSRNESENLLGRVQNTKRAALKAANRVLSIVLRDARNGECYDVEIRTSSEYALNSINQAISFDEEDCRVAHHVENSDLLRDTIIKRNLLKENWDIDITFEYGFR